MSFKNTEAVKTRSTRAKSRNLAKTRSNYIEKIISRVLHGTITKLTIKNKTGIIMGLKLKRKTVATDA